MLTRTEGSSDVDAEINHLDPRLRGDDGLHDARPVRVDVTIAALLFAFALGVRVLAIALSGFDGLYGQDAFAYLRYAGELKQALASFEPAPPFHWPIGYPLLVALASTLGASDARAAQWVSVVAGSLVAPLVYGLVCSVRPQAWRGALVAGLVAASAPQLLISSLSVMSDAAGVAWITLSAWALLRYQRRIDFDAAASRSPSGRAALLMLALAAFAFAMSVFTRWIYVVAAPVWALSALFAWHETRSTSRHRVAGALIALAIVLGVVGSQYVGDVSQGRAPHISSLHVAGWNPVNAFRSTVSNSDGVFRYDWPIGIFYAMPLVHPSFVFPLLSLFVCVGGVEISRGARSISALIIGWPLIIYLYLAGRPWENPRFALALLPPLLVLLGLGFARSLGSSAVARWRGPAMACAVLGICGSLAWNVRTVGRFVGAKNAQLDVVRWVERSTPEQTTIASFGLNDTLQHYTSRHVLNLYALDPQALATLLSSTSLEFLLIDPDNIAEQWRGKNPALNLEWLRNHATLTEVGRRAPWVLFKIEPRDT